MGATSATRLMIGKFERVRDAIAEMNEDSIYEYGHDHYSGAIHNCESWRVVTEHPRYGTKAFDKWEDEMDSKLHKGEGVYIELPKSWVAKNKSPRLKGKKGIRAYYFISVVPC
jgi:hypothetical protein